MTDAEGRDCTPSSARARALLAILARTDGHTRARRWIERTLWSDRSPQQASASLRTVLTEIRKALGPAAAQFHTDRDAVRLDGVTCDVETGPETALEALRTGRDLLENVQIGDPAFTQWREEALSRILEELGTLDRSILPGAVDPEQQPKRGLELRIKSYGEENEGQGAFVGALLGDTMANLIADFGCFSIYTEPGGATEPSDLVLGVSTLAVGHNVQVLAGLTRRDSGEVIWSDKARIDTQQPDLLQQGDIPRMVFHSAERVLTQDLSREADAGVALQVDARVNAAIAAMFTYDSAKLRHAETLLAEAAALLPLPRIAAWRSLLRQIMIVERIDPENATLYEEANLFAQMALVGNDGNALVSSLVAQLLAMLENDTGVSAALAEDAVRASPYNAFSHSAKATVALRAGEADTALNASRFAANLASRSSSAHWFDTLAGISAITVGDIAQAIGHLERAHARAPVFRAPMRHLMCLYAAGGQRDRAIAMAGKLRKVEPDFDILRVLEDESYPVLTLRRTNLLPPKQMARDLA
ncbi:hypothetical protein [Roseivivax lentus]|nr:hypothetical protein [Roseivivax lentus]